MKCADCGHLITLHGKWIPEQPPDGLHICICNYLETGICDCGSDKPTPAYFDKGCFDDTDGKFCGCISPI